MASLTSIYIKTEKLKEMVKALESKGDQVKGVSITIAVNDEINDYDQNSVAYVSQSKEELAQKKKKYYVGNGRCFWHNGKISTHKELKEQNNEQTSDSNYIF